MIKDCGAVGSPGNFKPDKNPRWLIARSIVSFHCDVLFIPWVLHESKTPGRLARLGIFAHPRFAVGFKRKKPGARVWRRVFFSGVGRFNKKLSGRSDMFFFFLWRRGAQCFMNLSHTRCSTIIATGLIPKMCVFLDGASIFVCGGACLYTSVELNAQHRLVEHCWPKLMVHLECGFADFCSEVSETLVYKRLRTMVFGVHPIELPNPAPRTRIGACHMGCP
jgi:hypothetical protein